MTQIRRLVFLAGPGSPCPYLILDAAGALVSRGVLHPGDVSPPICTVLIVPGSDVTARWLTLGAHSQAQARAAAREALKSEHGADREDLHISVGLTDSDGTLVCIASRSCMDAWLQQARELGLSPDMLVPDHLMLAAPEAGLRVAVIGGRVVVRGPQCAFTAENELAQLVIGDRAVELLRDEDALAHAIAANPHTPVNLLQQDYAPQRGERVARKDYRRAAVLAAALLLSPVLLTAARTVGVESAAAALEGRTQAAANAVAPAGTPEPVAFLLGRRADLQASETFLRTAAALFDATNRIEGGELQDLNYLAGGTTHATLVHREAADVARLARLLDASGVALQEDSTRKEEGRMSTAISLAPKP